MPLPISHFEICKSLHFLKEPPSNRDIPDTEATSLENTAFLHEFVYLNITLLALIRDINGISNHSYFHVHFNIPALNLYITYSNVCQLFLKKTGKSLEFSWTTKFYLENIDVCFSCTKEQIPTIFCEITNPKWTSTEEGFQTLCIYLHLHTPNLSPRSASENVIQYRAQLLKAYHSQLWTQLITSFSGLIHFLRVRNITRDMDYGMSLNIF